MGADLYIKNMDREKQICGFEVSARAVNNGYFRDCYNSMGLFSNIGLSWWETYEEYKLSENEGALKVEQIPSFREHVRAAWENRLKGNKPEYGKADFSKNKVRAEYEEWYNLLISFLDLAESSKSEIYFSV